jgi:hypothetical protein
VVLVTVGGCFPVAGDPVCVVEERPVLREDEVEGIAVASVLDRLAEIGAVTLITADGDLAGLLGVEPSADAVALEITSAGLGCPTETFVVPVTVHLEADALAFGAETELGVFRSDEAIDGWSASLAASSSVGEQSLRLALDAVSLAGDLSREGVVVAEIGE